MQSIVAEDNTVSQLEKLDFASFSEKFRKECIEGSGIHPDLYEAAIRIVADIEHEQWDEPHFPIHDALGWRQDRIITSKKQCRASNFAALFQNEDGSVWQAKLAIPRIDEKGKVVKYESPPWEISGGSRAYLPPVPASIREIISNRWGVEVPKEGSFWQWALTQKLIPLAITEGGKKALKLLSEGVVAIALYGCTSGLKSKNREGLPIDPTLIPDLEPFFIGCNRTVYIFFDKDEKKTTQENVKAAETKLGAVLSNKYGASVRLADWDRKKGKGIDDYMVAGGDLGFLLIHSSTSNFDGGEYKSKNKKLLKFFETEFGSRLRLNEMTLKCELDSSPLDLGTFFLDLADSHDIDISELKAGRMTWRSASKNSYSPVRDYLNSLPSDGDPNYLNGLAAKYLGNPDPFFGMLLRRTLIASIARAFDPGCKHDGVCILHGPQGIRKSSFWRTLFSPQFFTDSFGGGDCKDKDGIMKIRRYWGIESPEFENLFLKREVSEIKSFISIQVDSIRLPYGRELGDFPRTSVFVGSTNEPEFLRDATGERRFWVIPVLGRIPLGELELERDRIWASAIAAYRSSDLETRRWWLEPHEEIELAHKVQQFKVADPWEDEVARHIADETSVTLAEILEKLGVETKNQDRKMAARLTGILRLFGWEPGRSTKGRRVWKAPEKNKKTFFKENDVTNVTQRLETSRGGAFVGDVAGDVAQNSTSPNVTHEERLAQEVTHLGDVGDVASFLTSPTESTTQREIQRFDTGDVEFPGKKISQKQNDRLPPPNPITPEDAEFDAEALASVFQTLYEGDFLDRDTLAEFAELPDDNKRSVYNVCSEGVRLAIDCLMGRRKLHKGDIVRAAWYGRGGGEREIFEGIVLDILQGKVAKISLKNGDVIAVSVADAIVLPPPPELPAIGSKVKLTADGRIYQCYAHIGECAAFESVRSAWSGTAEMPEGILSEPYEPISDEAALVQEGAICRLRDDAFDAIAKSSKQKRVEPPNAGWEYTIESTEGRLIRCKRKGGGKGKREWQFSPSQLEVLQTPI